MEEFLGWYLLSMQIARNLDLGILTSLDSRLQTLGKIHIVDEITGHQLLISKGKNALHVCLGGLPA